MAGVRLILALHIHQPVGNFDGVFQAAYDDSYKPFLDVAEDYPEVPFVLHISGPLLDWLSANRPEYLVRVRKLVEADRVEILGGPYHEPILPNIPHRDRVGQMRAFGTRLKSVFGSAPKGMWLPERVWEQSLVGSIVEAGLEYTLLDDFHFERAGMESKSLRGFYLTEDEGRLLKLFPNSEQLRYLIPWKEPHETYEYLKQVAHETPGAVLVCGDDGEKFGGWPQTHDHVFARGWLRRFFDMLRGNREWIECTTLARAVESSLPKGKIYIPDASYREMTEWVLEPERYLELRAAQRDLQDSLNAGAIRRLGGGGGNWRNFRVKYPESDEMYVRMLAVSRRLAEAEASGIDPAIVESARMDLYRGQCNCPYWHGAFGGLYLPHLRNAIYKHLIAADVELDRIEGLTGPRVEAVVQDWNLDARNEVRLRNESLTAFIRPAQGAQLYELDVHAPGVNLLATLDRRVEAYHQVIVDAALGHAEGDAPPSVSQGVLFKHPDLDRLLVYDRSPRKAFVDHVYPLDATLDDAARCRDIERGDFAAGAYLGRVSREPSAVCLELERTGLADGHSIHIRKTYRLVASDPCITVNYQLSQLPRDRSIRFGVELNVAALAGHAPDRNYRTSEGESLGMLSSRIERSDCHGLRIIDDWMPLAIDLSWTQPGGLWCFPVETVSQSEGGFEGVYQSSVILPHWELRGDDANGGKWEVEIRWRVGPESGSTAGRSKGQVRESVAAGQLE